MINDPIAGFQPSIDPSSDNPPPEPPIYKTTNTGLRVALTVITGGMWGLFIWWPLHAIQKKQNAGKVVRYNAALSEYRHAAWTQRYGKP